MPLQIRRGTNAQRQILAVPLASGELLWTTDTEQLFIGDGNTLANALTPVVGYNDENAQDAAAAIFTNGSHTDITFTYNSNGSNTIDADVSLSAFRQNVNMGVWSLSGSGDITTTGTITAGAFRGDYKGSIFGDDSTLLVNAVDSSINLDGTVKGNIIPDTNLAYDLGSGSRRFNDLYLSGSSIFLGDAVINSVGTAVNLPSGSTIDGEPLGAATFAGTDLNVNIIGDDSSVIVDSSSGNINAGNIVALTVSGTFIGDTQGSVFADNSTLIVNAIDSSIHTSNIFHDNTALVVRNTTSGTESRLRLTAANARSYIDIAQEKTSAFSQFEKIGNLQWTQVVNGSSVAPVIQLADTSGWYCSTDPAGIHNIIANYLKWSDGKLSLGRQLPSATLDVAGNALFDAEVTATSFVGDLIGSVFTDSSTRILDGTSGELYSANIDVIGETGNTPTNDDPTTDAPTEWLELSVNGNTRYIPLYT